MISLLALRLPPPSRLSVKVSCVYGTLYLHYGLLTFLPLWLASRNVPATQIGALMAIPLLLRLVAVAPVVAWAGRQARLRDALGVFALLASLTAVFTGLLTDHLTLLAVFVIFSLAWDQLPVLADAYAVLAVRARGLDFGRLRVWSSLGVVAGAGAGGWIFDAAGIGVLPWLAAGLLLALAVVTRFTPPDRRLAPPDEAYPRDDWKAVFADRQLVLAMCATSLVAGSHGMLLNFGAIQWSGLGWSATTTGLLVSVGIVSEVLVLWFGQRLLRGRDPRLLILAASGLAVVRWSAMALTPPLGVVIVLQVMNAVTAIAPILGMMLLIARRTPAPLVGAAQGVNAVILGLGLAIVTIGSGMLWERGVPIAYGAMAAMAGLAAPLVLGPVRAWRVVEPNQHASRY
jgi:MFS transporter, PPP family, 3-phenylpropionic acid transporter